RTPARPAFPTRRSSDLVERPDLGYKLSGYVSDTGDGPGSPGWTVPIRAKNGGLHRLGSIKDVGRILAGQHLHEVIVALPATHHRSEEHTSELQSRGHLV